MARKHLQVMASVATLALAPVSAEAQMLVHDPAAVGQLISQAQTALSQLERLREQVGEAQKLYGSLNQASGVNSLAQTLLAPELRTFVPDIAKLEAAARGDLAALGALGERAKAIRDGARVYAPVAPTEADATLEQAGARAARDLALGEKVATSATARADGLEALRVALDAAPNARAVMDIEARLAAEQALIQNDQMRLQGVLMMQASEARLEAQREKEAAASAAPWSFALSDATQKSSIAPTARTARAGTAIAKITATPAERSRANARKHPLKPIGTVDAENEK